jgi:hypothetical protein
MTRRPGAATLTALGLALAAAAVAQEPEHPPEATYPSLHIIGFTDLSFWANDEPAPAVGSGFTEGQFVLHLTSALSSRIAFVGELTVSARRDAVVDPRAPGFNVEVERSILKYTHSDRVKLSVGRYHTPVSYWNVAFHHGQWLQTTAGRPDIVRFGGQFVPIHFLGVLAEGSLPGRGVNLGYSAGLGNGRSTVLSRPGDAVDVNESRAFVVSAFLRPDWLYGLQVGGTWYADLITLARTRHRERIWSAHLVWTKETPELIAEYIRVRHRSVATGSLADHEGYYAQVAYRLSALRSRVKPYYRFENLAIDEADPVFIELLDQTSHIAGVRVDAAELVALKIEYRRRETGARSPVNEAAAQVSFTF